jgi:hypothetical protein
MKVEILYFDVCPTYKTAMKTVQEVLAEQRTEAELEMVAVNSDERAQQLRFPGSSTIRIDGQEIFPTEDRADYRLGCRVYATPEGLRGSPTAVMIRIVLKRFLRSN